MEMEVHLKEKALPGLYLQYLDISEGHIISSMVLGQDKDT